MLTLNLPSCGICVKFGENWTVEPTHAGKDEFQFVEGVYPNYLIARMLVFFPSMWSSACYLAKQLNEQLLPDVPQAIPFTLPDTMAFDHTRDTIAYSMAWGLQLSYDAEASSYWTEDGIWQLFEFMASRAPESEVGSLILGALHSNYVADKFFYLLASKTGHCVRCNLNTNKWEAYEGEPEGTPLVSSVGITSYTPDGAEAPPLTQMIIGVNLLVSSVNIDYSTDLLKDIPEEMFWDVTFSTPIEQSLPLTTNPNRLFYLLNTDRDVPVQTKDDTALLERADPPTLRWEAIATIGTPLNLGGAFILDGGNGEYELYDVVRWLGEAFDAYETFANQYDNSHLSKLAIDQFIEKFSDVRVDVSPSKPSTALPIQLEIAPVTYAWDDVRWYPILGSQRLNTEVHDSFRYINMRVEMTTALWANLLKTLIDQFMSPECDGLAHLYYLTADLPDEDSAFDGEIHIVDHWRMQEAIFDGNSWTIKEAAPYSTEAKLTDTGLAIEVAGSGSVSAKHLAEIVKGAHEQASILLKNKFKDIDELCKDTAYGTYAQLHEFMPAAILDIRATPMGGLVNNIISPIVLYKDKQRLSHTATGWFYNNVPRDRTKKAGKIGDYTIGYETGLFPWGDDVARVIKDVLELTMDYTAPEVVASLELEHAN